MSFWGKTKATGYATTGVAAAVFGGLSAANGGGKFGYDEIATTLDAGAEALDGVNSYLDGDDPSDIKDDLDFDYDADTVDNISSGAKYGAVGLGLLGAGAYLFRSASKNW